MDEEKELNNISDADLWAMKAGELITIEREMHNDPKFSEKDINDIKEMIEQAVSNMEKAIEEERKMKEGKTK